jgi:uncharacterized membrane protein YgcG
MSLIDGIHHLFSHNDHCEVHTTYQPDCEACQLVRQRRQTHANTSDPIDTGSNYDLSSDTTPIFDSSPDTGSIDISSIDTGSSDFGGFDGGNSGGGGASGDF